GRLPARTGVGGAGQHAVLGGDPALALAFEEARDTVFHGGGAEHLGVTERHQDATLGMLGVMARKRHFTHLVGRAAGGTHGSSLGSDNGMGGPHCNEPAGPIARRHGRSARIAPRGRSLQGRCRSQPCWRIPEGAVPFASGAGSYNSFVAGPQLSNTNGTLSAHAMAEDPVMIRSMTAFARTDGHLDGVDLAWE